MQTEVQNLFFPNLLPSIKTGREKKLLEAFFNIPERKFCGTAALSHILPIVPSDDECNVANRITKRTTLSICFAQDKLCNRSYPGSNAAKYIITPQIKKATDQL